MSIDEPRDSFLTVVLGVGSAIRGAGILMLTGPSQRPPIVVSFPASLRRTCTVDRSLPTCGVFRMGGVFRIGGFRVGVGGFRMGVRYLVFMISILVGTGSAWSVGRQRIAQVAAGPEH